MVRGISRRKFVFACAGGASSVLMLNSLPQLMGAPSARADLIERQRSVLLVVFLRGGFDGLSLVCPSYGPDRRDYEAARPNLALPLQGPTAALPLDERFSLNSMAQPLHGLFKDNQLSFVLGSGLPVPSRSHFVAQTLMELGVERTGVDNRGWLTRFLLNNPSKAAVIGALRPTSLQGAENIMAYSRLRGLGLEGSQQYQMQLRSALRGLYGRKEVDGGYGLTALNMLDEFEELSLRSKNKEKEKAELPSGEIAQKFAIAGELLQRDLSLQVLTLDVGGWDTHRQQGSHGDGYFAKQLASLSKAIADFHKQTLLRSNAWVTTIVLSEFGRRLMENSNRGTDHGHGNVMMVVGPRVRGGTLQGRWPGLANENLFERADLAVTTDVRWVLHQALQTLAPGISLESVFPGAAVTKNDELKLFV